MKNVVVVGAQWGDEGKGKIVDILAPCFDVVARYQGGHNAGHTVRIDDRKFVLHLIPSGILHEQCKCVVGNGTVIDPRAFKAEVDELAAAGVECAGRLFVSDRAHLILPYHSALEAARELALGDNCVGTTMRGIGPAYEDKAARKGVRVGDIQRTSFFREQVRQNIEDANRQLASMGAAGLDRDALVEECASTAQVIEPFVLDTTRYVNDAVAADKSILLEGAQGTMLDIDHGTYPFVTSSSATAGGAAIGIGLSPKLITGTLGLAKAYTTRVGGGPFPTELLDDTGAYLQRRGNEFGASTGRPRRTGWFDAVVVRYSVMVNAFDALALPKLDVLDELDEIRVCTAYRRDGQISEDMPYGAHVLAECEPVYETLPGWRTSTRGITRFEDLPVAARDYIRRLEELVRAPIGLISTGPDRNATIVRPGLPIARWMAP